MIDDLTHEMSMPASRDERARKSFVSTLRGHVLVNMADNMHRHYHDTVAPRYEREHGEKPADGPTVHKLMKEEDYFRFYSSIRYNAQEMVWRSVIPGIERNLESLAEKAKALSDKEVGGTLTLDADFEVPKNVTRLDVHLAPGCYHSEFTEGDVATGAIYDQGLNVFAAGMMGDELCDIGDSFSNYVRLKFPDLKPERMLDMGCTVGHNTLPFAKLFPDCEVQAIDVAAPALRYAHARAQALGVPVHFRQMSATKLDYPDNHFDLVFSSMFLHELPLKDIRAALAEAHRVLKPGGILLTMELPPNNQSAPYDSFYLDWDSYYNQEPYYKPFRDQDYRELVAAAGFSSDAYFETVMPSWGHSDEAFFDDVIHAEGRFNDKTGRLTDGICWYGFGARK